MKPLPPGCILRRLRLTDEPALMEFFHSHSRETIFQRYHYQVAEMTHQRAINLLNVDQQRDVALGVFHYLPDELETIQAIARYYTDRCGQIAEVAFVVRESMRRQGLATRLLHELGAIAYPRKLRWLRAQVLCDNYAMQEFLTPYAERINTMLHADVVEYLVPVPPLLKSPFARSHHPHACEVSPR
jgi:GNAT superfamily N-acetyltransferase